jgi:cytochrome c oxidase cbb3-type subunit 2
MPAFTFLSDREVWAVVAHVKTFSPRWKTEKPGAPVELPPKPAAFTKEMIAQGQTIFMTKGACFICHGMQAMGDGPTAPGLVYTAGSQAGKPVRPANFHLSKDFKSGNRPEDIFKAISTGLDGTPMPSFAGVLSADERWSIVAWILSMNTPAVTSN